MRRRGPSCSNDAVGGYVTLCVSRLTRRARLRHDARTVRSPDVSPPSRTQAERVEPLDGRMLWVNICIAGARSRTFGCQALVQHGLNNSSPGRRRARSDRRLKRRCLPAVGRRLRDRCRRRWRDIGGLLSCRVPCRNRFVRISDSVQQSSSNQPETAFDTGCIAPGRRPARLAPKSSSQWYWLHQTRTR